VLAQAAGGLTCFLMPRFRPDSGVNALRFQRLKDKLGNRSNASSEVEFAGAFAWRVGDEGRGVRTIIDMVQLTRLDCAIASAGLMRMALAQAIQHARHRTVFQRRLADQPLMRAVLADLALEMEGVVALVFRLCRAFDRAADDPLEAAYARLLTPAVKYWVCKSAPGFVYEAMECLGGNGYVEEGVLSRIYREVPVNAIWEGSGNVMCLDVLRALRREPEAGEMLLRELQEIRGGNTAYDTCLDSLTRVLAQEVEEGFARRLVEQLALALQASLLLRHAPSFVAEAFLQARLGSSKGMQFGTLPPGVDCKQLLTRAWPD
jgi:putative acyl-CoA dehydrogenase